jgi:hypothetical protein
MVKSLLFLVATSILCCCKTSLKTFKTADTHKLGVKSSKFRGTIFDSTYDDAIIAFQQDLYPGRFTPNANEIILAEDILKSQIKQANTRRINQFRRRQYIDRNLNKYFRQYVGFVNKQGQRIIHINFHWNKFTLIDRLKGNWDDRLNYTSDYSRVLDGGSRFWNINVNLSEKKVYGMVVNGVAFITILPTTSVLQQAGLDRGTAATDRYSASVVSRQ